MITLAELMPNRDEHGKPMLKIYWLTATVHGKQKDRPAIEIAISIDGRSFLPTSSNLKFFDPKKHLLIPKSYQFFVETGLPEESYVLLDQPQVGVKKTRVFAGWLRGPLVDEVIRRSPLPVTVVGDNPGSPIVVIIRPWAFSRSVRARTEEQRQALRLWKEVAKNSVLSPPGEARYRGGRILVRRREPPSYEQWVRAATEWFFDNALSARDRKRWSGVVTKNPHDVRRLLITRDAHVPVVGEMSYEDIDRMSLAEAAVVLLAWMDGRLLPQSMSDFVVAHVAPLFALEASS